MTIGSQLDEQSNPSVGSGQSNSGNPGKSLCDPEANSADSAMSKYKEKSTQSSRDETIHEDEIWALVPR